MKAGEDESNQIQSINDITKARQLIGGLIALLAAETETRRNDEEVVNDTTYFGTLTAVIGVAAKSIAARNVGAGVAGISAATGGHYQLDKQKTAFKKALSNAQCVRAKLNDLDEDAYELFPDQMLGKDDDTGADYDKLYAKIPSLTYDRYLDIVSTLSDDLDGISTASGSLSDVQNLAGSIRDAAQKADSLKANEAGRAQAAQDKVQKDGVEVAHKQADLASAQATALSTRGGVEKSSSDRERAVAQAEAADADVIRAKQRIASIETTRDQAITERDELNRRLANARKGDAESLEKAQSVLNGFDAERLKAQNDFNAAYTAAAAARSAAAEAELKTNDAVARSRRAEDEVSAAKQRLAYAESVLRKSAIAADPASEPKRTAFLLSVINFKTDTELCTKVTVSK